MGCKESKSKEKAANERVAHDLRRAQKKDGELLKLLLLGTGDSGKTTIFKQMRILYGEGFSEERRAALRIAVCKNVVSGAKAIVEASLAGVAGRPLQDRALEFGKRILEVQEDAGLSAETAAAVDYLWRDADFQATWEDRAKFQVLDGWGEFAKQCDKYPMWGGPDWIPSVPDAIRARVRTSGIVEEKFEIDGINFVLLDVGGQRNERRKWIHCFQGVNAVIFVVAISEYDQMLFEDREKNRLQEALELFSEVVNAEWFRRTNLVVFLNKSDLYRNKLCYRHVPLNVSGLFPDAPTGFDFDEGVAWLKGRFNALCKDKNRSLFCHVTNATDTYNVQVVFDACKDAILRQSLEMLGLLR